MLGVPSADGAVNPAAPVVQLPPLQQQTTAATVAESGGSSEGGVGGGGGGDMTIGGGFNEEGERNSSGNRWPRQETLALLRIRSEMDIVFRDSSLKGPLWEEVSRKMADLGFHRSAKKCKEKFENVYKYHRRTKEGRASKSDGKTYRFFDELEAFAANTNSSHHHHSLQPPPLAATPITMAMPMRGNSTMSMSLSQNNTTVSSTHQNPLTVPTTVTPSSVVNRPLNNVSSMPVLSQPQPQPQQPPPPPPSVQPNITLNQMNNQGQGNASFVSNSMSSSSTSSDEDIQRRHGKKRKWKEFFEGLMKDVLEKQEELQKKFMETLEKRERERMVREETWRVQEVARMNREHDLLVQERSMAAAKDATIIAFLQKITGQQNIQIPNSTNTSPTQVQLHLPEKALATTPPHSQPQKQTQQPQPPPPPAQPVPLANVAVSLPMTIHAPVPTQVQSLPMPKIHEPPKTDNGGENFTQPSSSRWPKEEIEALIRLRTCLDLKYQENVPKGPLWEEISSGMRKLGYNRNAKRCKEKWENINKYYKKVKESNKKRPEDSKTCPYFHQLEELYKEKAKNEQIVQQNNTVAGFGLKPEINHPLIPIMAQPEQQWPLNNQDPPQQQPQQQQQQQHQGIMNQDNESDSMDEDEDMDDEDDDGEEEDEGNVYEIVTNKQQQQPSSMAAATTTAATATV